MKIKNEYVNGEVVEILPNIHGVSIKDQYQRTMLFCRYQEFYESPYKEIRGKFFTWEKFMMVYKNKMGKNHFTYPYDWSGFNIPSKIIEKGLTQFNKDKGPYDEIMNDIYYHCENYPLKSEKPRTKWYLIGYGNDVSTLNHEVAHGLYYTNKKYKSEMDLLILNIKKKHYNQMKKVLVGMGYVDDKKIIDDEIQAYISTGLIKGFNDEEIKKYKPEFEMVFKKYYNPKTK
jgi:hypothetical protein